MPLKRPRSPGGRPVKRPLSTDTRPLFADHYEPYGNLPPRVGALYNDCESRLSELPLCVAVCEVGTRVAEPAPFPAGPLSRDAERVARVALSYRDYTKVEISPHGDVLLHYTDTDPGAEESATHSPAMGRRLVFRPFVPDPCKHRIMASWTRGRRVYRGWHVAGCCQRAAHITPTAHWTSCDERGIVVRFTDDSRRRPTPHADPAVDRTLATWVALAQATDGHGTHALAAVQSLPFCFVSVYSDDGAVPMRSLWFGHDAHVRSMAFDPRGDLVVLVRHVATGYMGRVLDPDRRWALYTVRPGPIAAAAGAAQPENEADADSV